MCLINALFGLDADGDGFLTPVDFEILANKLSTLVGQDDTKRREEYASARKTLCQEIMRADTNLDGKVTLGERGNCSCQKTIILKILWLFLRRMA